MRLRLLEHKPQSWATIVLLLSLFVGFGYQHYKGGSGDDLASSYVGSRLLSENLSAHLFHYDPVNFAEIGEDDTWQMIGDQGHFRGFLHPYVQTPLWAYLLQPLCRRVDFPTFNKIFTLLTMLSFAGGIWITARYWAPRLFNPLAIAVTLVCLVLAQPFRYAMFLNQTHMLFVFLTLAALLLAQKDRPYTAGFLLACAAAVKVTPGLLAVYWLITGKWKAALSTAVWSAVLWGITVLAVGQPLVHEYLANLHRISGVLLLSQNNQSFAAWWMAHFYSPEEMFDINILPLPATVRLVSSGLMMAFTLWGGWMDRQTRTGPGSRSHAPLGAMMAMVAATAFAPIAWTHYAIVLLFPLMILVDRCSTLRVRWIWALLVCIALLNYRPIATDIIDGLVGTYSIVRGQFFACLLTLVALPVVAWLRARTRPAALAPIRADNVMAA